MQRWSRTIAGAALGAGLVLGQAGEAMAQACVVLPVSGQCIARFPNPTQRLHVTPTLIACDGVPAQTVQYDFFATVGGSLRYSCSATLPCSAPGQPPAVLAKFC